MDYFDEIDIMPDWDDDLPGRRYQAELIERRTAVYDVFDEMRTVHLRQDDDTPFYVLDAVTLFVMQAKFMEDFEDEYPQAVKFEQYFPTYAEMTDSQLRTYFTWRARARYGWFEETSLSYVFVYIYELIHQIGVESAEEGLEQLFALWDGYRQHDKKIDRYLSRWIKDYWVYYIGGDSYAELLKQYPAELRDDLLLYGEILQNNYDGKLDLFNRISSYKFMNSKFYNSESGGLLDWCIPLVLNAVGAYFAGRHLSFPQILLGPKEFNVWWEPFQEAVFHRDVTVPDRRVSIGKAETYVCKDGAWSVSRFQGNEAKKLLGYIIKSTEAALREATGYGKRMKVDKSGAISDYGHEQSLLKAVRDPSFDETIKLAVKNYVKVATKKAVKKITIDTGKLDAIRMAAADIQEKLTIEDEPEQELEQVVAVVQQEYTAADLRTTEPDLTEAGLPIISAPTQPDLLKASLAIPPNRQEISVPVPPGNNGLSGMETGSPWTSFVAALAAAQKRCLQVLVNGEAVRENLLALARQENVLQEVLLETINELSLEYLDDTILDLTGDAPVIYDDYLDEAARALEE